MMIWQWPISSIRRINFRNAICRAGDSADSGSSKIKMPCFWQRSSKKTQKAFAVGMGEEVGRRAASHWISGDREKAFRAERPAMGDFRQPAGAQRAGQSASHFLQRP